MAEFDVIVVGGGPAGVHAARAAASAGLKVALFDEKPADSAPPELARSSVSTFFAHEVWGLTGQYRVDALGPQGPTRCTAPALIVATGATERIVPFEGWTLPGVIDIATAASMLRAEGRLPGRSAVVAGCGPWLAAVAANMLDSGVHVAAIVDLSGMPEWARALKAIAGARNWRRTIRRAGTPLYARHTVVRVEPASEGWCATLAPCDGEGRVLDAPSTTVFADCIVVGHGSIPSTEVTGLMRVRHRHARDAGGWIADVDEFGRSSRHRLYVAGAAAGSVDADAAAGHGMLVGLGCASDLADSTTAQPSGRIESARSEHRRRADLGRALAQLSALRSAHVQGISARTIVCRCEEVTRAQIDAACDAGAHDMNQLKAWTRCGMGPCQGRMCQDIAGELLMQRMGASSRVAVGCFTARMPLRPVAVEALTGEFRYEDIAIPNAAPL